MGTPKQPPQSADADLQPSDYASGFVEGWLRAQGVQGTPTIPEFREALTELDEEVPPDRALPVELEMRKPVGGLHQRCARARRCDRETNAVGGLDEADRLLHESESC